MKPAICLLALLLVSAASAEKQPFERYQPIVDRQMFGPLPPDFDPTKSPNDVQKSSSRGDAELTQDQAKLKSAIRFSVIDVKADGTVAVGFTDNSDPKTPKNYYLRVGESRDGWEVKSADADSATMTIAKGEIEVSLSLGGDSAKGGGTSAASAANAAAQPRTGLLGGSLRGARQLRRQQEAEARAAEEARRQAKEEEREAERQAKAEEEKQQRDAERAEQRQQLLAIQEELKRVREAKAAQANEGSGDAANEAE